MLHRVVPHTGVHGQHILESMGYWGLGWRWTWEEVRGRKELAIKLIKI